MGGRTKYKLKNLEVVAVGDKGLHGGMYQKVWVGSVQSWAGVFKKGRSGVALTQFSSCSSIQDLMRQGLWVA